MSADQIQEAYVRLPIVEKSRFLSYVVYDLTIFARSGYAKPNADRFKALNEIIHVISGEISKLLSLDEKRYPDNMVIDVMMEKCRYDPAQSCEHELVKAIENAFTWLANSQ